MREVFEKLVSYFIVITINELKCSIFSQSKDEYTCANGNEGG